MTDPAPNLTAPNAGPATWLPPHLTKLGAPMHTVEVRWQMCNVERLVIGPEPKLVLAVKARRDVELLTLRVDYPRMGHADMAGQYVEAVLMQVPHVTGLSRLRPHRGSEPWVWGQEDVPASCMFGGKPEDAATAPEQIRWYGATVPCIEYNRNEAPNIWWCWRGRVSIPRGLSVGVIIRASTYTPCRAMLAGV